MPDSQAMPLDNKRSALLQELLLLGFCFLVGVAALAVCAYLAMIGQLMTLDGMVLCLVSLAIGGIFMLNVAWSVYTGELLALLNDLRKKPASGEPSDNPS